MNISIQSVVVDSNNRLHSSSVEQMLTPEGVNDCLAWVASMIIELESVFVFLTILKCFWRFYIIKCFWDEFFWISVVTASRESCDICELNAYVCRAHSEPVVCCFILWV